MKFTNPIPIADIARKINAEIIGDESLLATGLNEIHKVEPGDITFVDVPKYFSKSLHSAASIIIINEKVDCPDGKALLYCEKPFDAYNHLAWEFRPFRPLSASISDSANIHPSSVIEPGVVIGNQVRIGRNSYIQANAYIGDYTIIGDNVNIQAGVLIGTDAFYYKKNPDGFVKWRSVGRVIIEDNVEIGAGCTINRGVSGDTIIGAGTKLDCQCHIAHGVVIGKNCLIAAQTGIAGKSVLEDGVVLYGQVGVVQNVRIGAKAVVLAKGGISKDVEGGITYFGAPAGEVKEMYRQVAALRMLPDLIRKIKP